MLESLTWSKLFFFTRNQSALWEFMQFFFCFLSSSSSKIITAYVMNAMQCHGMVYLYGLYGVLYIPTIKYKSMIIAATDDRMKNKLIITRKKKKKEKPKTTHSCIKCISATCHNLLPVLHFSYFLNCTKKKKKKKKNALPHHSAKMKANCK